MNAYVAPEMERYLSGLRRGSTPCARAPSCRWCAPTAGSWASTPRARPGPDDAVRARRRRQRRRARRAAAGYDRMVTFDIGGTSTDVAVCLDGRPQMTRETRSGSSRSRRPASTVQPIGAGGGSIAWVSRRPRAPARRPAERGRAARARLLRHRWQRADGDRRQCHSRPPAAAAGRRRHDPRRRGWPARPSGAWRRSWRRRSPEAAAAGDGSTSSTRTCSAPCASSRCRRASTRADHGALVAFGGAGAAARQRARPPARLLSRDRAAEPGVLSALGFVAAGFANEFNQTLIRPLADLAPEDVRGAARRAGHRGAPLAGRTRAWPEAAGARCATRPTCATAARATRSAIESVDLDTLDTLDSPRRALSGRRGASGCTASRWPGGVEVVNLRATAVGRGGSQELALATREEAGDAAPEPAAEQRMW